MTLFSPDCRHVAVNLPLPAELARDFILPEVLRSATPKRQEEFLAGRYCAGEALKQFGLASYQVGLNEDRSPLWPAGFVGAITHSKDYAAAVVAKAETHLGLGLDSELIMSEERAQKLKEGILTGSELCRTDATWVTLVFSAKESIYKALRPLAGEYFGFADAELVEVTRDSFRFQLTRAIGGPFQQNWEGLGRHQQVGSWVHTAVELKPDQP